MISRIKVEGDILYFNVTSEKIFSFSLRVNGEETYSSSFYCSSGNEYYISHPSIRNKNCFLSCDGIQKIKINFKVHHIVPWETETNKIGTYLNYLFDMIEDGDWICILDGDAVHTTTWFGKRIENTIRENLSYSMFSCLTNRTTPDCQIAPGSNWEDNDISNHRKLGEELWEKNRTSVHDITHSSPASGYLFLVSKETWENSGKFDESRMLGIEWDFCERVKKSGGKIGIMQGIYVYHWYRGGNKFDNRHLM